MASSIEGVDSLHQRLDNLDAIFRSRDIERAVQRGCMTVQAEAKLLCPVDSGELRNSIMTKVETSNNSVIGKVYTNKEYASYVEFGTGSRGEASYDGEVDVTYNTEWAGQPAQPYLYPALKNNEDEVIRNIQRDIAKEIRRVVGNA